MPIPTPKDNESQDAYMHRCMAVVGNEGKPHDQAIAICLTTYKRKKKKSKEGDKNGTTKKTN